MLTPKNIADYLLCLTNPEAGDFMSNLKIQKLVYYVQGFNLAMYNEKLFEEPILAWEHGPVVESLYHEFKSFGASGIPQPEEIDFSTYNDNQKALIEEVYQVYGQFSAWKLRNMTHSERPWIETPQNQEIDTELMKEFFKDYIS